MCYQEIPQGREPTETTSSSKVLFATQDAEVHIENKGVIDISAEIKEFGTTTHDEWYSDLRDTIPPLDKVYNYVKTPEFNKIEEETRQGVTPMEPCRPPFSTPARHETSENTVTTSLSQATHPARCKRWQPDKKKRPPRLRPWSTTSVNPLKRST